MIISIWRYSHLALAVFSFVFITLASITGIILAFEPVSNKMQPYEVPQASELSLAETIETLTSTYAEVLSLSVDANGFVSASVIDEEGNLGDFYVNPFTGEKMGTLIEKSPLFQFATNLHRSLFLKSVGRFFVGLSSFLLFLIAVTGVILIIKRQQGIRHFLDKIIRENFFQYYHVYLGRLALLPIIIITLTGVYLSLLRFSIIPAEALSHSIDFEAITDVPAIAYQDFPLFRNTPLSELRSLEFPFSEDVEDYYSLKLQTKEVLVNQYTGEVLSELSYPFTTLATNLSTTLHTGQGSIIWSVILGLSSVSILFFIYSGFSMTLKRRGSKIKNTLSKDACKYVILVGSETGSTIPFALQLQQALLKAGETVYLAELNRYTTYKKMEHLVVVTATYGQGEPPTNADKFEALFMQNKPSKPYTYSVVGFGSLAYSDFCQFAFDVDQLLQSDPQSTKLLAPFTINNRSWESFRQWVREWSQVLELPLEVSGEDPGPVKKIQKKHTFRVVEKTRAADSPDDTFLIQLEAIQKQPYTSGDLLAICPAEDTFDRLYSIGLTRENRILLSVKRHAQGVCSSYLDQLTPEDSLEAGIIKNRGFHFPVKASRVLLISTGTGIAPFLGMLAHNKQRIETHLYWGGRNKNSLSLYQDIIESSLQNQRLAKFSPAYSRNGSPTVYVQELIQKDAALIACTFRSKGTIMICGSVAMQKEVISVLEHICSNHNNKPLSYYQNRNQLKMDCY
ncbi:MAG: PepSY domain-containing protein [Cyclobacteriaceae bacterium]